MVRCGGFGTNVCDLNHSNSARVLFFLVGNVVIFIVNILNEVSCWRAKLDHLAVRFHFGGSFRTNSEKLKYVGGWNVVYRTGQDFFA